MRLARSTSDVLRYVERVGFCTLFPQRGLPVVSAWEAVAGKAPLPPVHDDERLSLLWHAKDRLATERRVYYAKLLRRKPTLVSLAMLPVFYAATGNTGDLNEHERLFAEGRLSREALRVARLMEEGVRSTYRLHLRTGGAKSRLDRALAELSTTMVVAVAGVVAEGPYRYSFAHDFVPRLFPREVAEGTRTNTEEARRALVDAYRRANDGDEADARQVLGPLIGPSRRG